MPHVEAMDLGLLNYTFLKKDTVHLKVQIENYSACGIWLNPRYIILWLFAKINFHSWCKSKPYLQVSLLFVKNINFI